MKGSLFFLQNSGLIRELSSVKILGYYWDIKKFNVIYIKEIKTLFLGPFSRDSLVYQILRMLPPFIKVYIYNLKNSDIINLYRLILFHIFTVKHFLSVIRKISFVY